MRIRSLLRPWRMLALAVFVAALASVGAMASETAAPTIYACAKSKGGALHVISAKAKCSRREKRLVWSTAGPAGPSGPAGVAGAPGAAGPATDLGSAYEAARAVGPTGVLHGTEEFPPSPLTTVATLAGLPAGSYEIRGVTNINTPNEGFSVACRLSAGSDTDVAENQSHGEYDAAVNMTTQLLHSFAASGTVTLDCGAEGKLPADTWSATNTTIIAVPVAAAHVAQVSG